MNKLISIIAAVLYGCAGFAQNHRFDPPWNEPLPAAVQFTVPGIDNVPDLYGDIVNPQLVVFFAGNQFMCMDDLVKGFKAKYPQYTRIFVETLPPGILAKQLTGGSLTVGNLRIDLKPDIYTAGKEGIVAMADRFERTEAYAYNTLCLMVAAGNPKRVTGLADLEREDLRISMPNPAWEGVAKQIEQAYVKAGGESLRTAVMQIKVADSSTYLTRIHHRESPMRILYGESDVAPVWTSEVHYQQMIGHPVEAVRIPVEYNVKVTYVAGQLKNALHTAAASAFMDYLASDEAKQIYQKYGFETSL